jgi:hypothetical protein
MSAFSLLCATFQNFYFTLIYGKYMMFKMNFNEMKDCIELVYRPKPIRSVGLYTSIAPSKKYHQNSFTLFDVKHERDGET